MFKKVASYHNIVRDIARLAFPIIIGQLGLVLMPFADIIMLGRISTLSMSAAGVGNAVFFLFILIGIGGMYAVSTLTSIADGEGKPQQAVPIFYSALKVSIILSILLMVLNYFLFDNLHIFGQSAELTAQAKDFLFIVNFSVLPLMFFNAGKHVMDGLGKTRIAMYVTFFALGLNILLNYLLIWGNFGFPRMELRGAAWATVISRFAMAIVMICWLCWHPLYKSLKKLQIEYRSYIVAILRIGMPVGFTFFFEIAAFSIALIMAGNISDMHSAAHQIAINLASITYMFVTGIAAAANILVGNFYGAKDKEGIRRAGFAAILFTIGIEVVFFLIFLIFKNQLPYMYTEDVAVMTIAPGLILLAAFFQMSDGLQTVAAGALRGIKDTTVTSAIAFLSYWIIMIPGAWYLCFKTSLGIEGIWIAFIVGLTFAAVLLLFRFNRMSRPNKIIFTDEDGN